MFSALVGVWNIVKIIRIEKSVIGEITEGMKEWRLEEGFQDALFNNNKNRYCATIKKKLFLIEKVSLLLEMKTKLKIKIKMYLFLDTYPQKN